MINTDLSVQKRWVARRGYNNPFTLTITSSGSAYNVSSYVFVCNIRKIGASTNLLQLTEGLGITNGGATGIVSVQLSASNSNLLNEGSYYYEIYYTVGGLSYGLLHGTLDLLTQFNGENVDDSIAISVNLAGTDVNVAITLGGGGGVSSFSAGNLSPLFTSSVATATTTPALSFTAVNQNANLVYAGPSTGAAAAPTFRALVAADLPITGTPDGTKFLRDDLVWSVPSGGGTIGGSIASTQVAFGSGSNTIQGVADFIYNTTNKVLTIGTTSITSRSTGDIYIGNTVGNFTSTGLNNIQIGQDLATGWTDTEYSVNIGYQAGKNTISGQYDVNIGYRAGMNADDHFNVFIGYDAGVNCSGGSENVGIGYRAIYNAQGEDNVGIGFSPGSSLTGSGRDNIIIGYYAAAPNDAGASGIDYTNGSKSIFIGSYVTAMSATESGQINIGNSIFGRYNSATNPPPTTETGNIGIYTQDPTARLHLPAGQATANKAPLKFTSGTHLTTTEAGAMEFDGTHLYFTIANGGSRFQLDQQSGVGGYTNLTQFVDQTPWQIFYSNGSGDVTELAFGTTGKVLTSNGASSAPTWETPAGGSSAFSGLTGATGTNTIDNAAYANEWQWNSLAAQTGLLLSSSSTAAASNTNKLFRVNQTGANSTASQTTYSGYFSNTKTGTTNTNVAVYATASGASTRNYAIQTLGAALFETATTQYIAIKASSGNEWISFDNGRIIYLNSNGSNDRITPTSGTLAFLAANATAIDHYTFTGNNALTATSGTARMMVLSKGITVSSGTTVFTALDIVGTYNITGGTLTVNGIKYAPTLTSMTGATHYFINAASGRVLLGGLPTSAAGLATGELWNNSGVVNVA